MRPIFQGVAHQHPASPDPARLYRHLGDRASWRQRLCDRRYGRYHVLVERRRLGDRDCHHPQPDLDRRSPRARAHSVMRCSMITTGSRACSAGSISGRSTPWATPSSYTCSLRPVSLRFNESCLSSPNANLKAMCASTTPTVPVLRLRKAIMLAFCCRRPPGSRTKVRGTYPVLHSLRADRYHAARSKPRAVLVLALRPLHL